MTSSPKFAQPRFSLGALVPTRLLPHSPTLFKSRPSTPHPPSSSRAQVLVCCEGARHSPFCSCTSASPAAAARSLPPDDWPAPSCTQTSPAKRVTSNPPTRASQGPLLALQLCSQPTAAQRQRNNNNWCNNWLHKRSVQRWEQHEAQLFSQLGRTTRGTTASTTSYTTWCTTRCTTGRTAQLAWNNWWTPPCAASWSTECSEEQL
jgi:hypothetical protein